MAVTCIPLLGRNRNSVYGGSRNFVFRCSCDLRRGDIFLNHSRAYRGIRGTVDQNEAARRPVTGVGIEKQRNMRLEFNETDFVHLQASGRFVRQRIYVDTMEDAQCSDLGLPSGVFYEIGSAKFEGCPVKPDDPRMEFSRNFREMVRRDEHVASAEIDLLIQLQGHGHGGGSPR